MVQGDPMIKKSLTKELIISSAFAMIDEKGKDNFSMRQLAAKLGVQVSSLYNHVKNEHELMLEVAKLAAAKYTEHVVQAVSGIELDDATTESADAFRSFLKDHRYLYELLIDESLLSDPGFQQAIKGFEAPIFYILKEYGVEDKEFMEHMYVAMRVVTHGFSTLDSLGVFDHLEIDTTESYHMMVRSVVEAMKAKGNKN